MLYGEVKLRFFGTDGSKYARLYIGEEVHPDRFEATTKIAYKFYY